VTLLLVLLLIATGASATPDDSGRLRSLTIYTPHQSNSGGPFPGWFYGVPILIAAALLVIALLAALRRIAAAPRIGTADVAAVDTALRSALTRFVMLVGCAVVVLYLGAVALTSGSVFRSASQWSELTPAFQKIVDAKAKGHRTFSFIATPKDQIHGVVQPTYTLGAIGAVAGVVIIGVAIVLALLAISNLAIRWSVAAADREEVDA
jgi:hypothetical protein